MGWNYSRVVILSWDGTTPGESLCTGMERLQGSQSVLGWNESMGVILCGGWNDSRVVILCWDGTSPWESFCPGDGTTPGESFCPRIERLLGSHSGLG